MACRGRRAAGTFLLLGMASAVSSAGSASQAELPEMDVPGLAGVQVADRDRKAGHRAVDRWHGNVRVGSGSKSR